LLEEAEYTSKSQMSGREGVDADAESNRKDAQSGGSNIQENSHPNFNNYKNTNSNTSNNHNSSSGSSSSSSSSISDVKIGGDVKSRLSSILSSDPSVQWDLDQLNMPLSASQLLFRRQLQSLRSRLASTSNLSASASASTCNGTMSFTADSAAAGLSSSYSPLLSQTYPLKTSSTTTNSSDSNSHFASLVSGDLKKQSRDNVNTNTNTASGTSTSTSSSLNEIKREFENRRKSNVVKMLQLLREIDPAIDDKRGNELIHKFLE
jgi:hypothetical protein